MGTCALCGLNAVLKLSHYLPAAFYRRLHSGGLPPISIDAQRKTYQCKQIKTKLLCGDCEHRFKIGGEDWVIDSTCKATGGFFLRDELLRNRPFGETSLPRKAFMYRADTLVKLRHAEIIYFAASVFWRGCIVDWSQIDPQINKVEVLPELELELRSFLLRRSSFPKSLVLHVEVALNPMLGGRLNMTFPNKMLSRMPGRGSETIGYSFNVFGVTFSLYFGAGIPAGMGRGKITSIAEPPHLILLTDVRMSEIQARWQELESTAKRLGRLARA